MRSVAHFAFVLMLSIWTVSPVFAAGPSYRLEVAGLACPFCAYGIEKKLNAIDGVQRVETHIGEGAVMVTMKDGAELARATAKRAVKQAGFTLDGFERR